MNRKTSLIFGITGQDGSYLAELLIKKGHNVHGMVRRSSSNNTSRIAHILDKVTLHYGDITDPENVRSAILKSNPDEIYNLAAMSDVGVSYHMPWFTANVNAIGIVNILGAVLSSAHDCKIYQASSSEMFGNTRQVPQNELTPFNPQSPYGAAKAYAYNIMRIYRDGYGLRAYNGILFNHESPRRGERFVSKKIAMGVAAIKAGKQKKLRLGNLDSKRDFGYAPEYVDAIYRIMQHDKPNDFVIATGEQHTIREFVEEAFSVAGLNWKDHVEIDKTLLRPNEVNSLRGDYRKAREILGWEPKTYFHDIVRVMVEHELKK